LLGTDSYSAFSNSVNFDFSFVSRSFDLKKRGEGEERRGEGLVWKAEARREAIVVMLTVGNGVRFKFKGFYGSVSARGMRFIRS
jgi:hypothetical protein